MSRGSQEFYGNGIRIYGGLSDDFDQRGLRVAFPRISVIDKKSKLDVDLSRRKLKSIPEEDALIRETFRYHIARLLLTTWDTEEEYRQNFTLGFHLHENGLRGRIPYFLSPGGFALNYASFVPALSIREYVILFYVGQDARAALRNAQSFLGDVPCSIAAFDPEQEYYLEHPRNFVEKVLCENHPLYDRYANRYRVPDHAAAVWLGENPWRNVGKNRVTFSDVSCSAGIWTASFCGRHSKMPIRREQFSIDEFPVAIHVVPDHNHEDFRRCADSLFVQILKDTLVPEPDYPDQDLWIPFDMEERKKKFKTVFKKLAPYIEYIKKHPIE